MNTRQTAAFRGNYHATFAQLCQEFDLPKTSEQRHQLTEWILGYKKSSSQFTGKEYSLIIDQMKEWIRGGVEPHPLTRTEQDRRSHDERHKQLVHVIEQLAPEAYIQHVAEQRFGKRPWRNWGAFQLQRLRYTLTARAAAARKKGQPLKS